MIVIFGSLNMDMVISVDHFPRPGETCLGSQLTYYPGGKGANQAVAAVRAAARQSEEVYVMGCVGRDTFGDHLIQTLTHENIQTQGISRGENPTGCASIWVNQEADNQIVVARGANQELKYTDVPSSLLTPHTVLVLQMEVPAEQNWKLVKRAAPLGARIILNLAPAGPIPLDILPLLEGLILNEGEAQALAHYLKCDITTLANWGRQLAHQYGFWIVITRGRNGALLCTSHEVWEAPALFVRPVDTTAAGDAFTGTFAAFLSIGTPLPDCLHHAVVAGGLACLEKGAIPSLPSRASILAARYDLPQPSKVA